MDKNTKPFVEDCPIAGLKVIHPKVFPDSRGYFSEVYNKVEWAREIDFHEEFVQDNHSYSHNAVLRGLHAQPKMGKLVQVISGEIYDVAVDIRPNSQTYGKHHGIILNDKEKKCFWIPDGFLHGFVVLSPEGAHVVYKCSAAYDSATEFGINAFDPALAINWPIAKEQCVISDRDKAHCCLKDRSA